MNWKRVVRTNSLLWPCTHKTRLSAPHITFYRHYESVKFGHSITNAIEFVVEYYDEEEEWFGWWF